MILPLAEARDRDPAWDACRFLTASVLPVRLACNLRCPFCFSRSSISALAREQSLRGRDVLAYYRFARARGATRLVITGGGEPLLRPEDVLWLVELGREVFGEIACFTNGTYLTRDLARRLHDAGLSYLCYSRHAASDADNEALMGRGAPSLAAFFEAAGPLKVRATCVMARGHVDGPEAVWRYIAALRPHGVTELTFKHTYVAYETSVFQGSAEDTRSHQVEADPFEGLGAIVGRLPWGPVIRRIEDLQLCYYREPTPAWELLNRTGRSTNLLSDGSVYASLEDRRSLLYRLPPC
jgi:pyruvate-formate lyase-activating enzyme